MASKLPCPSCKRMLREEGDKMKRARGEYRVYDANNPHRDRIIHCLACGYMALVEVWVAFDLAEMRRPIKAPARPRRPTER